MAEAVALRFPVALLFAALTFGDPLPTVRSAFNDAETCWQDFVQTVVYVEFRLDPGYFGFTNIVFSGNDDWPIRSLDLASPLPAKIGAALERPETLQEIGEALCRFASDNEEGRAWLNLLWRASDPHLRVILASDVGEVLAQHVYPIIEPSSGDEAASSLISQENGWSESGVRFWKELRRRIDLASIPFPPAALPEERLAA